MGVPLLQTVIEACVEDAEGARQAAASGADRIELCIRLDVGGLTPPPALVLETVAAVRVPVFVMIRPRAGDFDYSDDEFGRMLADAQASIEAGAAGLVSGALTPEGRIDTERTGALVRAAHRRPVTFHKAFDEAVDVLAALEALIDLGVHRVLTSGGHETAEQGAAVLADLVRRSEGRLAVMAGGRVRAENAQRILQETGVRELHARGIAIADLVRAVRPDQ